MSGPAMAPGYAPDTRHTNGLAIASLVLALVSFPLLLILVGILVAIAAIVLAFVALSQIGKSQSTPEAQKGKGLAVAGLVVGVLSLLSSLVVVAAIAIPVFLNQRDNAGVTSLQADLRDAALAEEVYLTETGSYTNNTADLRAAGFTPTSGVNLTIVSDGTSAYCIQGTTSSGQTFHYSSSSGAGVADGGCRVF